MLETQDFEIESLEKSPSQGPLNQIPEQQEPSELLQKQLHVMKYINSLSSEIVKPPNYREVHFTKSDLIKLNPNPSRSNSSEN